MSAGKGNYILGIADAQATGSTIQTISIRASIDRDLLLSLVEPGEFAGISLESEFTDENLQEWLNANEKASVESLSLEEPEAAIKSNFRMNINKPDPEVGIKGLFVDVKTFLRIRK